METLQDISNELIDEYIYNYLKKYSKKVIKQLQKNTLQKYNEWGIIKTQYNTYEHVNHFIDEDDENSFLCSFEDHMRFGNETCDYPNCYSMNNCSFYQRMNNKKYEDILINYSYFYKEFSNKYEHIIRNYSKYSNLIHHFKNGIDEYDSSVYCSSVRNDYIKFVLKEILNTNDDYDLRKSHYSIYHYQIKWLNIDHFISTKRKGIPDNYRDLFKMNYIITDIYDKETKYKLFKKLCVEKLNMLDHIMLKRLNIDCWNLICVYLIKL